ncbi:alpha/beta hydrolase [Clostridium fermenticellae]|uniref:Alpha/beta hydrolase n=1 Tax=Clostridium fermenticellae TaxID=2068654 RepID=A0A386H5Q8_9CLOT|nr:alpha/beta hydrolase [Clostridium fermenticellae]AYD41049.1 alpha/beta hydrolase [Clostridium fermenticellae]
MFIKVNDMNIFYKKSGSGKKIVLLHGWGGKADSFLPVYNYLSSTYEVYAIDFPGFGRSDEPPEPWNVTDYANMLLGFFEALNIDKAILIGHSFGGRVSILFSSMYGDRVEKVVLTDSAGLIPKRSLKYYLSVYKFKALKKLYLTFTPGKDKDEKLERFYRTHGSDDYREARAMRGTFVKVINQDLRPCLPKINVPTLLIWGDQDEETPLSFGQIMEKEIPDAALIVFKGAGHFAYLDKINDFNKIVSKFLGGN